METGRAIVVTGADFSGKRVPTHKSNFPPRQKNITHAFFARKYNPETGIWQNPFGDESTDLTLIAPHVSMVNNPTKINTISQMGGKDVVFLRQNSPITKAFGTNIVSDVDRYTVEIVFTNSGTGPLGVNVTRVLCGANTSDGKYWVFYSTTNTGKMRINIQGVETDLVAVPAILVKTTISIVFDNIAKTVLIYVNGVIDTVISSANIGKWKGIFQLGSSATGLSLSHCHFGGVMIYSEAVSAPNVAIDHTFLNAAF